MLLDIWMNIAVPMVIVGVIAFLSCLGSTTWDE